MQAAVGDVDDVIQQQQEPTITTQNSLAPFYLKDAQQRVLSRHVSQEAAPQLEKVWHGNDYGHKHMQRTLIALS